MDKYSLKIAIIGSSNCGKSSIVERTCNNKFSNRTDTTIGAAFNTYQINNNNCEINFNIWDVAGQERFRSLLPLYYNNAQAILIIYDITDYETFENAKSLYHDVIKHNSHKPIIILVGNKSDLKDKRVIKTEQGKQFADLKSIHFIETSAKNSHNILKMFYIISNNLDSTLKEPVHDVIEDLKWKYNCCIIS